MQNAGSIPLAKLLESWMMEESSTNFHKSIKIDRESPSAYSWAWRGLSSHIVRNMNRLGKQPHVSSPHIPFLLLSQLNMLILITPPPFQYAHKCTDLSLQNSITQSLDLSFDSSLFMYHLQIKIEAFIFKLEVTCFWKLRCSVLTTWRFTNLIHYPPCTGINIIFWY